MVRRGLAFHNMRGSQFRRHMMQFMDMECNSRLFSHNISIDKVLLHQGNFLVHKLGILSHQEILGILNYSSELMQKNLPIPKIKE
jgi:hypothetical protein